MERLLGVRLQLVAQVEEAQAEAGEALDLASVYRREAGAAQQEAEHLQEQLQQVGRLWGEGWPAAAWPQVKAQG